jgi:hypothetical protein
LTERRFRMSPKPSRITPFPLEASGVAEELVFGEEGRPSLVIPKALIAQIWAQVSEGTRMLSRGGGLEVGGLLVGPKVRGGKVTIDEIVPVAIEYEHGPSFQMSSSDLERIGPAVESVQDDQSKVVVGFYRSRTRGDGTLRESDLEIFDAIQRAHSSYDADFRTCFVLAPVAESTALACIAVRYGGGWHEMQPFTLRSNPLAIIAMPPANALLPIVKNFHSDDSALPPALSNSAMQAVGEIRTAERRLTEHRMTERRLPEPRVMEQQPPDDGPEVAPLVAWVRGLPPKVWLVAASLMVLIAGLLVYRGFQKPAEPVSTRVEATANTHLGFSATREGPVWKLSWDRAAMDALNPIGAVLSIEDGGYDQQVPLAPPDLASGTLFYTPQSSDLTFKLRIDRGGSHIEEDVRVLEAPKLGSKPVERAPQASPSEPAKAPPTARNEPPTKATPPVAPATTPPRKFTPPSPSQTAAVSAPEAPSPPPAMVLAVPVPPAIVQRANLDVAAAPAQPPPPAATSPTPPAAPRTTTGTTTTPVTATAVTPTPTPQVNPNNTTAASTAKGPVPSTTPAAATKGPAPAAPAPTKANYVGPKPIQQVRPQAPPNTASGVSQVQVLVEIDSSGKVTQATPVGWNSTNAPLMSLAVRAASSWVFEPAKLNGHGVPSEMNLIFRF